MKKHLHLILALSLAGGCISTSPVIPTRYQVLTPEATAGNAIVIRGDDPDNSYIISVMAVTNTAGISPGDPAIADIATNQWPSKRFHIDLSIDGQQTWRRIGHMVQFDNPRLACDFVWSPPEDYSLMSTNAYIRTVVPEGLTWPVRSPPMPYDLAPGTVPTAGPFTIGGATILSPEAGTIQWRGTSTSVQWHSVGAGSVVSLYWLTPTSMGVDVSHWITTISNNVDGISSRVISLNAPVADAIKLVLVSHSDPRIHGYSGAFIVDP